MMPFLWQHAGGVGTIGEFNAAIMVAKKSAFEPIPHHG
jgi:hypothetical protein